jgi:dynein heavy chain
MQARDNVKFLSTLERHFRSISSGPLTGILDTLPLLMNALRMIWIISRYYSDDAHMGGLFARIANELCDRVNGAIMLHTLFRMPADEAVELLRVSKAVLECWQSTYMQVRHQNHGLELHVWSATAWYVANIAGPHQAAKHLMSASPPCVSTNAGARAH